MKFGRVPNPQDIDFTLPQDHQDTKRVLDKTKTKLAPNIYVGCAKWNKADLKGFYPRGTKDELHYYASQFNAIELNATFYRIFSPEQFQKWYAKTPSNFRFFPKIAQDISHWKRLHDVNNLVARYLDSALNLKEKLGTIFLQLHNNFAPKEFNKVEHFIAMWPKEVPLAIEFRHTDWYNDGVVSDELYALLEQHQVTNIIVDTAGRRDLMHMRLTNGNTFIRYVGANHSSDYTRLNDWVNRLKIWQDQGITDINFFIHQNIEKSSPLLAGYFIEKLNEKLGSNIKIPNKNLQQTLL